MEGVIEFEEMECFAKWIENMGDGNIGDNNGGHSEFDILSSILLKSTGDPIKSIVDITFPNFLDGNFDHNYLRSRAIWAPTLDVVDSINEYMSDLNRAEGKTYLRCDTICKFDNNGEVLAELHTPEFLNGLRCSGVPNHSLTLKVGSPVMLLRNIDHSLGLCNGTRLVVTKLADHVIEAKKMGGNNEGSRVLILRMSLTPSDPRLPFKFQRRQFPLMLSYAMTINKSQGQTLSHVGLFLKKPVFNLGQLYMVVSRVSNQKGLNLLVLDESGNDYISIINVVYKEVFNNL